MTDIIFQHRVASIRWARAHEQAFVQDEFGEYLPMDEEKNAELDEAIEECYQIEQRIKYLMETAS